jgi:hypothetical protein
MAKIPDELGFTPKCARQIHTLRSAPHRQPKFAGGLETEVSGDVAAPLHIAVLATRHLESKPPKRNRGALHTIGYPMAPSASQRTLTLRRTYEHGGMFTAAGIPRGACRCKTEVSQDAPESVRSGSLRWRASAPSMLPSLRWRVACAIAARRWSLSRSRPQTSRGL